MSGSADQVVALLGKGTHAVAEVQVAQAQELGDGYRVGAGQAGTALLAGARGKTALAGLPSAIQGLAMAGLKPAALLRSQAFGEIQVAGLGGPQGQA